MNCKFNKVSSCNIADKDLHFSPSIFQKQEEEKIKSKTIPVDWCLKTKIRFTSSSPFPSRGSFRTFEEVNGTVGFVRCLHSNEAFKKVCNHLDL